MNKRLILLLVLVVLGAFALWLSKRSAPTSLDLAFSDFAVPDTAKVDRIFIADQHGRSIDLRRTRSGWTVNGTYNTEQIRIDQLLRTFNRIEVRSPVPKSAEATVLRTMAAGGRKVEIYQGGKKPSKIWMVGHATMDHFGTYMLLEKPGEGRSSVPFVVNMAGFTGVLNTRFHTNLDEWRSSSVFAFNDPYDLAAVEVEQPGVAAASYRIENPGRGVVRLLDLKGQPLPMDTIMVKGALLPYQQINYEYIERNLSATGRDSLKATTPNRILRVFHRNGTEQDAKFWFKPYTGAEPTFDETRPLHDPVRMYALVQDSLLVVVQRAMFDPLMQPISAFRP